ALPGPGPRGGGGPATGEPGRRQPGRHHRGVRGGLPPALQPDADGSAPRGAQLARRGVRAPARGLGGADSTGRGGSHRATPAQGGASGLLRGGPGLRGDARLRSLRPRAGEPVRRSGHRRGARVHHGGRAGRPPPRGRAPDPDRRARPGQRVMDPITLDICWNRLIGVVNEQAAALMRTSFTSIVREAGDLSAGVFDRRGWMVAQAVTGTPGHINSMALAMKHVLDVYPVDAWEPGDVVITND